MSWVFATRFWGGVTVAHFRLHRIANNRVHRVLLLLSKFKNSNKVAPPVATSQGAGSYGREGTTNKVPRPGRPPSPLVSDPAPIVTSNPF